MSVVPNPVPLSQLDTAIRLCALSNLQSALALPLLAARQAPDGARTVYGLVVDHIQGSIATFGTMRRDAAAVSGPKEALQHDTVEYSTRELQRVLDELAMSRSELGERRALRQMPRRLERAIRRLVATLPDDSPLRAVQWSSSLEAASAVPTAQLVHYLALSPVGVVVRQTLHTTQRPGAASPSRS